MGSKSRRALMPGVGQLEGRELPSSAVIAALAQANPLPSRAALLDSAGSRGLQAAAASSPTPPSNPAPFAPGQGQPTALELRRQAFTASFTGPYTIGPGRFSDQSRLAFFRGIGGSNQFLHGDLEMGIVTPTDPAASVTGAAVMNDKSTNSGGLLGLDLVADQSSLDSKGRPTTLSLSADPNVYSGIYFINTSSGTVSIRYHSARRGARGVVSGIATVSFQASVYTSGLTNPLRNSSLYNQQ